jgi:hypothetical protein
MSINHRFPLAPASGRRKSSHSSQYILLRLYLWKAQQFAGTRPLNKAAPLQQAAKAQVGAVFSFNAPMEHFK